MSADLNAYLEEMSKIARDSLEGEPVVDYDESLSTLHISDPYFAFYLRWRINSKIAPEAADQVSVSITQQVLAGRDTYVIGRAFGGDVVVGGDVSGVIAHPADKDDEP